MINLVVLGGRMTSDADVRKTNSGISVCNFSIAVQKNKDSADFIRCVAWDKQAEIMGYSKKGDYIEVQGKLETSSYEKDGRRIEATTVRAVYISRVQSKKVEVDPFTEMPLKTPEIDPEELPF